MGIVHQDDCAPKNVFDSQSVGCVPLVEVGVGDTYTICTECAFEKGMTE